jgi:hypothetical protein
MVNYRNQLSNAVKVFWETREIQKEKQGSSTGKKDYGSRSSVTGGKQLDGFISLFNSMLKELGLSERSIHIRNSILPGYFRPTKEWDLVVVENNQLIATIECKSHIGPSFGNNFNNRVEEALGSASDIWTAYREGAFNISPRPWLGYLLVLEEHEKSLKPVKNREPHFPVFPEYDSASYLKRYELFCEKLMKERIYDSACLIVSDRENGRLGSYKEPVKELNFHNFISSLSGKVTEYLLKIGTIE